MEPIEKLVVCSQALYDARLSELKNENIDLAIKLFWTTHTEKKLEKIIK